MVKQFFFVFEKQKEENSREYAIFTIPSFICRFNCLAAAQNFIGVGCDYKGPGQDFQTMGAIKRET